MKIITKKIQNKIEKNRDIIYDYIRKHPIDNSKEMSDAVEALCDISCDCGIWNSPPSSIVKRHEITVSFGEYINRKEKCD